MTSNSTLRVARTAVYEVILGILPSLRPADIDESLHLKHLGADSVDRVEIIMGVLERLGLQEPLSSFSGVPSIGALIELLEQLEIKARAK
jgi:polyketide biosynthesis acyl carrier protein